MSLKSSFTTTMTVNYPVSDIVGVLSNVEHYPDWNPALTYVGPSGDDGVHPVVAHRMFKGNLTRVIAEKSVRLTISIPGLVEESTFVLEEVGNGTRIKHAVNQNGIFVKLIGQQEASLVPGKRLTRLAYTLSGLELAREGEKKI